MQNGNAGSLHHTTWKCIELLYVNSANAGEQRDCMHYIFQLLLRGWGFCVSVLTREKQWARGFVTRAIVSHASWVCQLKRVALCKCRRTHWQTKMNLAWFPTIAVMRGFFYRGKLVFIRQFTVHWLPVWLLLVLLTGLSTGETQKSSKNGL